MTMLSTDNVRDSDRRAMPADARPMATKGTVGERIKAAREAKGITMNRLAHLVGLDPGNLSRIENGERKGTMLGHAVVEALCRELGVPPADLGYAGVVAASAPPRERAVSRDDDRYPTRAAALAALRAQGVAEELIGIVASLRAHSEEDPGVGYWMIDAVREARTLIVASRAAATEEDDAFTTPKIKGSRRK